MASETEILIDVLTNDGTGQKVSSFATDYVFKGNVFTFSDYSTITSGAKKHYLIDPTAMTKFFTVYQPKYTGNGAPFLITIYSGTDYAGGSDVVINNRAFYGEDSEVVIKKDATGTMLGDVFSKTLLSGSSQGAFVAGSSASENLEYVPDKTVKYLIEIENLNGTDAGFCINFTWFETE